MAERLQKLLAGAGFGSRRQVDAWIGAGRITVDGKPAMLGQKVDGSELIKIDGRPVQVRTTRLGVAKALMYNKPSGEICTHT